MKPGAWITEQGWRGLTGHGEVLEVKGRDGQPVNVPENDIVVWRQGKPVGRRALTNDLGDMRIEDYLESFGRAVARYRANDLDEALRAADACVALAPTLRARFNRAMVLLAMGRWREGFEQYECRLEFGEPFLRIAETGDITRWDGGSLAGKRLLLMHEQGFGDTLMTLRYVPLLRTLGAEVMLAVPPELERIAAGVAEIARPPFEAHLYCPMMSLLHLLGQTPESVPGLTLSRRRSAPRRGTMLDHRAMGLTQDRHRLVGGQARRWRLSPIDPDRAAGRCHPRAQTDAQLYSLQAQGADEAQALGVQTRRSRTSPTAPRSLRRWTRSSASTPRHCMSPAPSGIRVHRAAFALGELAMARQSLLPGHATLPTDFARRLVERTGAALREVQFRKIHEVATMATKLLRVSPIPRRTSLARRFHGSLRHEMTNEDESLNESDAGGSLSNRVG